MNGPEPTGLVAWSGPLPSGMTEECGMASTYLNVELGAVSLISSLLSETALMPLTEPVGFLAYASAPATPDQNETTGDLVAGSRIREYE